MTAHVPIDARVRLVHGVLQVIADEVGIDILHVKGPAVSAELRPTRLAPDPETGALVEVPIPRASSDADIVVRPAQVDAFLQAAEARGWQRKSSFRSGSAFGHALNIYHPRLGNADVHRHFPGIGLDPARAFDALWVRREAAVLANRVCPVPAVDAQRLILLLHAARSGGVRHSDTELCWGQASTVQRDEVRALARAFDAELGLAAAIGELDQFKDHREYLLWRHFAADEEARRLDEWRGRLAAASSLRKKAAVAIDFATVNRDHLAQQLGRKPTRRDLVSAYVNRLRRLAADLTQRRTGRRDT